MSQLSISMPPALEQWVGERLAEGRHADASDYLRDLVRRDQEAAAEDRLWLRAMIDEGLASPVIDAEPEAVIETIIADRHARRA